MMRVQDYIDHSPLIRSPVVGFTGTQNGMTREQLASVRAILRQLDPKRLHHGDCIGADEQCDSIARALHIPLGIHPPSDPSKRAFCARPGDIVWAPIPYLLRNRDIVTCAQVLVATPKGFEEELRSGTWATIRYAREQRILRYIVLPDGSLRHAEIQNKPKGKAHRKTTKVHRRRGTT